MYITMYLWVDILIQCSQKLTTRIHDILLFNLGMKVANAINVYLGCKENSFVLIKILCYNLNNDDDDDDICHIVKAVLKWIVLCE